MNLHSDVGKAFSEKGERADGATCCQMGFKRVVNFVTLLLAASSLAAVSMPCARSLHQKKTHWPHFLPPFFQLAPSAVRGLSSSASLCSRLPSISGAVFPLRTSCRPSLLEASGANPYSLPEWILPLAA